MSLTHCFWSKLQGCEASLDDLFKNEISSILHSLVNIWGHATGRFAEGHKFRYEMAELWKNKRDKSFTSYQSIWEFFHMNIPQSNMWLEWQYKEDTHVCRFFNTWIGDLSLGECYIRFWSCICDIRWWSCLCNIGEQLSVLDGVPIAVKDEIDCLPYPTTGGTTWLHTQRKVIDDATCVRHLRECGHCL